MRRIVFAAVGALCILCAACSKEEPDPYARVADTRWVGTYAVRTENGTTGELEDHTGTMVLQFSQDGKSCIVETGIEGLYASNRKTLHVGWSDGARFTLSEASECYAMIYYSGAVRGDKMALQALSCDGVAANYELSRRFTIY